jgi:beta-glucosidase
MGLTPRLEGEEMSVELDGFNGGDRTDIDLPDAQKELIKKITQLGKPTVLVLLNGSALAIPEEHSQVNAVLEAWYGGQAGGTAIADVLFGNYNPSGRLPVTFYKSTDDLPPFEDYAMANRTYRYFEGEALYSFGHGLSYTTFTYGDIRVNNRSTTNEEAVIVEVEVTNTGDRAGDEVVQLYVSYPESEVIRPIRDLRGFDRIFLESGETKTVEFTLNTEELRYWDSEADAWVLEKGPVKLQVGASSADIRQEFTIDIR